MSSDDLNDLFDVDIEELELSAPTAEDGAAMAWPTTTITTCAIC